MSRRKSGHQCFIRGIAEITVRCSKCNHEFSFTCDLNDIKDWDFQGECWGDSGTDFPDTDCPNCEARLKGKY